MRPADVEAVLEERGEFVDMNREDLEGLLVALERRIHRRFSASCAAQT